MLSMFNFKSGAGYSLGFLGICDERETKCKFDVLSAIDFAF